MQLDILKIITISLGVIGIVGIIIILIFVVLLFLRLIKVLKRIEEILKFDIKSAILPVKEILNKLSEILSSLSEGVRTTRVNLWSILDKFAAHFDKSIRLINFFTKIIKFIKRKKR